MPYGRVYARDLEELSAYDGDNPYVVDAMQSPPGQLVFDGERVTCFPPAGTTFGGYVFVDTQSGVESWRVTVLGTLPESLPVPQLPADWGAALVPSGPGLLRVTSARTDADPQDSSFAEFWYHVTTTATSAVIIE